MNNADTARVFKAFCDETRLEIITLLKSGEMCANDILKNVGVVQSTLSHHMKILCESGIVLSRKSGKLTYYSISGGGIDRAAALIEGYRGEGATANAGVSAEGTKAGKAKDTRVKTAPEPEEEDSWSKMVTFID